MLRLEHMPHLMYEMCLDINRSISPPWLHFIKGTRCFSREIVSVEKALIRKVYIPIGSHCYLVRLKMKPLSIINSNFRVIYEISVNRSRQINFTRS